MFLQDFDLRFLHLPGHAMGPADTLSRLLDSNISTNNVDVTVLPANLFIHLIDTALVEKITLSSSSNPLVVSALQNLSVGSPLFPCSSLSNWHFSDSLLYYKNCLYVLATARHNLVSSIHTSPAAGHGGFFRTYTLLSRDYWWLGMLSFICRFVAGCALCQQMKVNTHLTIPVLSPLSSACSCPFQQLSVDLVTGLPLSDGFDSQLVMVDHGLSKGVILTPCNAIIDAKGVCYSTRIWTILFHHSSTTINHWFAFYFYHSHFLLHGHLPIHCVVGFSFSSWMLFS